VADHQDDYQFGAYAEHVGIGPVAFARPLQRQLSEELLGPKGMISEQNLVKNARPYADG